MYIVKLYNDGIETEIHGKKEKLKSGTLVQGINTIDSFTFSLLPDNAGFNEVKDYTTLVSIYNTRKKKQVFYGRVLNSVPEMTESGQISKAVVCESFLGFFCDSKQKYVFEKNWTVTELWEHIISIHNSQLEEHKHFALGEVTAEDTNDNLYLGIQRDNSWKTINEKLIAKIGGEVRFRVVNGVTYIDHLKSIGTTRATAIKLSRNMKSIRQENDPTAYITRLIPLGAKLTDEEGNETEERLDITSVNDGIEYIEDVDARKAHGIRVEHAIFDDVTVPSNLKSKGEAFLRENNRVKVKYVISYVDLSLLGLDIDDIDVYDRYPIVNPLLGIDDIARVIKKTTDICNETKSTIEIGDKFKTLSEINSSQSSKVQQLENTIGKIESEYVSNDELLSEKRVTNSIIEQTTSSILASVEDLYAKKTTTEEFMRTTTAQLELLAENLNLKFTEAERKINSVDGDLQSKFNTISKYFSFSINGLEIGATYIDENGEEKTSPNKVVIDNDEITIMVNGVPVQKFDADGKATVPMLTVGTSLNLLGLVVTEDETHINCGYIEG